MTASPEIPSPEIQEIIEDFELLGDWDARYQYLVEVGERLAPMPAVEKTEANRVKECMSLVHVSPHADGSTPPRLHFSGDCDTAIIKGVVAILVRLFSGKTPAEIADLDVDTLFEGLHLDEHLSPNRHVGVYAIVEKLKGQARALA
jgi:cysteine desulfuration protein SufE